jgi:prepilin-type N-terminal cleavage/methylation domain-containing protein
MSGPSVTRAARAGMTLIELTIALTVFGIVITSAVAFAASQNTAFQTAIHRMGALRNVRYAVTMLEQDLATLGTNVPTEQPTLLYGAADVVVFSADYATNLTPDAFAVFYDPDAPAGQVQAPTTAFTVPTTAMTLPDTTYAPGGLPSPAELITFYFTPDTMSARTDDHILYRQINGGTPEEVARNLFRVGGAPFFGYERSVLDSLGSLLMESVPDSVLPLWHEAPIHLSPADTGRAAWADSVRAVRVQVAGSNGLTGDQERRVEVMRVITLPNAGMRQLSTCGSAPLLGSVSFGALLTTNMAGDPVIDLTWTPAVDEAGGEADVVRYVLWRKVNGAADWGDPYLAIPAGAATYTYVDASVTSGYVYQYALAAQDCTPTLSALSASPLVVVP